MFALSFRTGVHCVPANEKIIDKSPPLVLAILVTCAISTLVTMVFILLILRVSLVLRHMSVLKQTLQILTRKNLKWQVQLYNFHVFKIILIYIYLVLFFFFFLLRQIKHNPIILIFTFIVTAHKVACLCCTISIVTFHYQQVKKWTSTRRKTWVSQVSIDYVYEVMAKNGFQHQAAPWHSLQKPSDF